MIYIIQSNLSIIYMYIHDNIITSATLKYAELPRLCKLPMELLLAKLPNDKGGGGGYCHAKQCRKITILCIENFKHKYFIRSCEKLQTYCVIQA